MDINLLAPCGTPFVWDKHLPAGLCEKDEDGLWHVGPGTDLSQFRFEVGLTKSDKRFLRSLKIQTSED